MTDGAKLSLRKDIHVSHHLHHLTRRAVLSLVCAVSVAVAGTACRPGARRSRLGDEHLQPKYDAGGRLQALEYDRNDDGKVDTWGYMDGSRVVRVEVDENGDGTVDRWEYHREAGSSRPVPGPAGVDKTVERIERATKFDGKVSRWEFFTDGVLARVEEDTDADGKVDKWETYTDGALTLMALDTSGRGTPDRRLVYGADGSLDHVEADAAGSGAFDTLKP